MNWPPLLADIPTAAWERADGDRRLRTRLALDRYVLDVHAVAADTAADGTQDLADDGTVDEHLRGLYEPEAPWQTYRAFGRDYVVFAVPSPDQDTPPAVTVDASPDAWVDKVIDVPGLVEYERLLSTLVVHGQCALHVEAREVSGADQAFTTYPADRDDLAALAGWAGPYPTVTMFDRTYVLFAYPHGD